MNPLNKVKDDPDTQQPSAPPSDARNHFRPNISRFELSFTSSHFYIRYDQNMYKTFRTFRNLHRPLHQSLYSRRMVTGMSNLLKKPIKLALVQLASGS